MKDRYGKVFYINEIQNRDEIGLSDPKSLDEFSAAQISKDFVLIRSPKNGAKLFLFDDLKQILKANFYCRLEDPFTREDILDQVPEFQAAIELEQKAVQYNAYILDKNPDFILLLNTYVNEVLNGKDLFAGRSISKGSLYANQSPKLNKFYEKIADFSEEKRAEFFSMFITNRSAFHSLNLGLWILPAKWEVNATDFRELSVYKKCKLSGLYSDFPHRNVLLSDLITDPETSCMHSWGMDVLHMLLEYHIGKNIPYPAPNKVVYDHINLHETLSAQIKTRLKPGSLNPHEGQEAYEKIQSIFIDKRIVKLKQKCAGYLDYILDRAYINKKNIYPEPNKLNKVNSILLAKYQAVYELYSALMKNIPGKNDEECLSHFSQLFNQKARQETIAGHRDSVGVRFLNVIISTLSLGLKNLLSYVSTGGYWGFWHSRGSYLNTELAEISKQSICVP